MMLWYVFKQSELLSTSTKYDVDARVKQRCAGAMDVVAAADT